MVGFEGPLKFNDLTFDSMHRRSLRTPQNYRKEKVLQKEAEFQSRKLGIEANQSKRQLIVDIHMSEDKKDVSSRNVIAEPVIKKTLGK